MKKLLCICLSLVLILCACGGASEETTAPTETTAATEPPTETTPPTTEPPETEETKPQFGVFGKTIILGNFEFTTPDGFLTTVAGDNSFAVVSEDESCVFSLVAMDISDLNSDYAKEYLPKQSETFSLPEEDRFDESTLECPVGTFNVEFTSYAALYDGTSPVVRIETTFTDSWYAYTIMYTCYTSSDRSTEYASLFGSFVRDAVHSGASQRFSFIQ